MFAWPTALCGAMVSLAGVGRARRWLMVLLPRLMPTYYTLILPSLIRPTARPIVTTVSPSAVWYTSLGFVRSGRISPRSVMWPGNESDFWSRTASNYGTSTNAGAHNFYANYGSTNSSLGNYRYVGFPVRCLVILVYL